MAKNKLNLVVDFNNLAMRTLFTCQFVETNIDIVNFDTDEECEVLVRKLASDISYIIRIFSPDRTIMACDSKLPWRSELYVDMEGKYKGTREHDENKNWSKIFASFNEFKEIMRKNDFVVSEIENTEADDLAAMWKEHIVDEDSENIILVSSDKDWTQLISFDDRTKCFCACYNPIINPRKQKKFYVTEKMKEWFDEQDRVDIFFNNHSVIKDKIKNILRLDSKIVLDVLNPELVVLEKVMCGDDGDNVPAFFDFYKNGRKNRVTPLKASHVFESLYINNIDDLIRANKEHTLKNALEKEMKRDVDIDFDKRLDRQRKLVELKSSLFPERIVKEFNTHINDVKNKGYEIASSTIKIDDLLKGTKYISENYHKKMKENSIFSELRSLTERPNLNKLF